MSVFEYNQVEGSEFGVSHQAISRCKEQRDWRRALHIFNELQLQRLRPSQAHLSSASGMLKNDVESI